MLLPESVRWVRYAWHGAARISLVSYRITNDPMFRGSTRSNPVEDSTVAVQMSICIHVSRSGIVPGPLCRSRAGIFRYQKFRLDHGNMLDTYSVV